MSEKFNNKYRIESTRLRWWDYGWNAPYFITICVKNMDIHYLGDIKNGKMNLSEIGKMAEKYWYEIPQHFPFVKLDAFIVMPNHIHGIVIIDKIDDGRNTGNGHNTIVEHGETVDRNTVNGNGGTVEAQDLAPLPSAPHMHSNPSTQKKQPKQSDTTQIPQPPSKNKFGPQSRNLASIIRGYKIGVTKYTRQINSNFAWQARYYDRIIRDEKALQTIRNYIINNPAKWTKDKLNRKN